MWGLQFLLTSMAGCQRNMRSNCTKFPQALQTNFPRHFWNLTGSYDLKKMKYRYLLYYILCSYFIKLLIKRSYCVLCNYKDGFVHYYYTRDWVWILSWRMKKSPKSPGHRLGKQWYSFIIYKAVLGFLMCFTDVTKIR